MYNSENSFYVGSNNNWELPKFICIVYSLFSILLCYFFFKDDGKLPEFIFQLSTAFFFVVFFIWGQYYSPQKFCVIVFIYQLLFSGFLCLFFWDHQYILSNNNDWITYKDWAVEGVKTSNFIDYFQVIKKIAFEVSDWGFPMFLYWPFKVMRNIVDSLLIATLLKCFFFTISSWYVYKLFLFFTDSYQSKQIFLLYSLNSSFIFFNAVNLKESVFSIICVFAVYNLVVFSKRNNIKSFILFLIFLSISVFFRVYVSFFIIFTFISTTFMRKIIINHFYFMWIVVGVLGFVTIFFLSKHVSLINYVVEQSIKGKGGFSMPILIITGMLFPVPALTQLRTPDNFLVCGYAFFSIVLSFYAVYEIFLIFKEKKSNLYPILFLVFFMKLYVIIGCRVNEYRFQTPLVFSYFCFMILGFFEVQQSNGICIPGTKKVISSKIINFVIIIMALLVTFLYNSSSSVL